MRILSEDRENPGSCFLPGNDMTDSSNPRILFLSSSFLPTIGGLQYELKWFLDNLDRRLSERGDMQVHFAYPNEDSEPYTHFNHISTHDLQLSDLRKPTVAWMLSRLGRLLRRIRPDIVHCHGILPDGLWVLLASRLFQVRTKIVVSSHGQDIVWLPQWHYGLRQSIRARLLARQVAKRISAHVLPSRALLGFALEAGTPKKNITIIPNGIPVGPDYDFEQDSPGYPFKPECDTADLRQGDGLNILSLSSAREIKNLDALIEAFALVKPKLGSSKLLLACDNPAAQRIVRLVKDRGLSQQVVFIGTVTGPTKHSCIRSSDIYCLPSYFENCPLSLLEAMKFETAVLATRAGGIPEFVEDGKNGLLVFPTDREGMAAALVRLHRDAGLRRRLIRNGLQTVKRYSISRTIEAHLALYLRLCHSEVSGSLTA